MVSNIYTQVLRGNTKSNWDKGALWGIDPTNPTYINTVWGYGYKWGF